MGLRPGEINLRIILPGSVLLLLLARCGGSETARRESTSGRGAFPGYMADAESTFHPADYGIETWESDTASLPAAEASPPADSAAAAQPDTIPGFRVQVTISEDIDAANALRDSLSEIFPDEWVYIVYHPPYYKIRIGNYADRFVAAGMLDSLRHQGFPDAWIVPDRVLRNAPPRPLPPPPDSTDSALPPR
jgi:hypothetical protein